MPRLLTTQTPVIIGNPLFDLILSYLVYWLQILWVDRYSYFQNQMALITFAQQLSWLLAVGCIFDCEQFFGFTSTPILAKIQQKVCLRWAIRFSHI